MIRGMGMKIQDAFQGQFRKKNAKAAKGPEPEIKSRERKAAVPLETRITYLSSRQLEEAALAERYLLENLDHGNDFKNLFFLQHQFLIVELEEPSFCDLCGLLIWGIYRLSLKCRNCSLTCHPQCKQFLRLVCPKPRPHRPVPSHKEISLSSEVDQLSEDESGELPQDPSLHNVASNNIPERPLEKKVAEFNKSFPFALLHLEMDGSFNGFVRIMLRLKRPITVSNVGPFPGARVTSFYLPRNSEKLIHVSSLDRTPDVMSAILTKFRIRDDPRKFGLHLEGRDGCRRLAKDDIPLEMVLDANESCSECCRLILEETDTRNVLWDAFTLPELENFKTILDREEEEWLKQTQHNYMLYRAKLQAEIASRDAESKLSSENVPTE
ncbi:ras association domain-containing protein 1-like [Paramacrobiotus metropolitanus]|uniref:ras association domain-containing protein 1-like n=1 Tax=Paramacrobiotus metropolitanus TaxID=2943436 RepID=UPI002445E730|nr:ras association domain-containing protein 1-like [Paramacrobiotus metropolitanus]XP_055342923.1 ras association domain-containing protein 1-like [Paramacrobiotus metropolitanus]